MQTLKHPWLDGTNKEAGHDLIHNVRKNFNGKKTFKKGTFW